MPKKLLPYTSIIDKHGKILGKIHVFDALIICAIALGLIVVGKQVLKQETWIIAELNVTPPQWWSDNLPPPNWLAASIQTGDKELDWKGDTLAEVLGTKIYDPGWDRKVIYATVKFKTHYDTRRQQHLFKNQIITIGNDVAINLTHTSLNGIIVSLDGSQDSAETITKEVVVKLYDRFPWYADAISVGDTMKVNDDTIAEVINKRVTLAEKTTLTTDSGGNLKVSMVDPLRRDIEVRLKLTLVSDKDNNLIFRGDQRVKVGNELWVSLANINLTYANIITVE